MDRDVFPQSTRSERARSKEPVGGTFQRHEDRRGGSSGEFLHRGQVGRDRGYFENARDGDWKKQRGVDESREGLARERGTAQFVESSFDQSRWHGGSQSSRFETSAREVGVQLRHGQQDSPYHISREHAI